MKFKSAEEIRNFLTNPLFKDIDIGLADSDGYVAFYNGANGRPASTFVYLSDEDNYESLNRVTVLFDH